MKTRNPIPKPGKEKKEVLPKSNKQLIDKLFELGHKWCCICGSTSGLTFSHFFKDSTMKGKQRWEYNNVENGCLMCMTCHQKYDNLSNDMDIVNPETRIGYILSKMKDIKYARRIAQRMFWLRNGRVKQERVHSDISNE